MDKGIFWHIYEERSNILDGGIPLTRGAIFYSVKINYIDVVHFPKGRTAAFTEKQFKGPVQQHE